MLINGEFGVYNGIEYELNEDMQGNLLIITSDEKKIDSSFVDTYGTGVFSKIVDKKQLEDIYGIKTYGIIDGVNVSIRDEDDDSYLIGVKDEIIAKKLNLNRVDKYFYEGYVSKLAIEVRVEKYTI